MNSNLCDYNWTPRDNKDVTSELRENGVRR